MRETEFTAETLRRRDWRKEIKEVRDVTAMTNPRLDFSLFCFSLSCFSLLRFFSASQRLSGEMTFSSFFSAPPLLRVEEIFFDGQVTSC